MQLTSFSASKYRSIIKAHRLPMSASTVLIGKNNEGKSNLLAGLSAAMEVVEQLARVRIIKGRIRGASLRRRRYNWERDFPVSLQDSAPNGESVFRLRFKLDQAEQEDFQREVGSKISDELPVEIRMGRSDPFFKVIKQGPGSKALNSQREKVAEFIGGRVVFTYIPAVRTAEAAISVVRDMVARDLRALEKDPDYAAAIAKITELQKPVLDSLGQVIRESLQGFMPSVQEVKVRLDEDDRYRAIRRSIDVVVDDGTATSLGRKGDGVQSLAAIGLLRGTATEGRHLILGLEEPESHLHPSAIHRLRGVLRDLAAEHQIVITTHSPVFADRVDVASNILVEASLAKPATSIDEIREALGVRASDNLRHAEVVLVVEGLSDVRILGAVLAQESPVLASALSENTLVIDSIGGGGKLGYKLSELRNAITEYHCFLDNDDAGRSAVTKAQADGLLTPSEFHVTSPPGGSDAELEDMLDAQVYRTEIEQHFGVKLVGKQWKGKGKWSSRLKQTMTAQGKTWSDNVEHDAKRIVADAVVEAPSEALNAARRGPVDSLIRSLLEKLPGGSS
ncbi:MAG: ATP-binding protein [Bacteroidota bacterium]